LQRASSVTGLIYCPDVAARKHRLLGDGAKGFPEVLKPQMITQRFMPVVQGRSSHTIRRHTKARPNHGLNTRRAAIFARLQRTLPRIKPWISH